MNEKENESFRFVYQFYDKWRSVIIETEDQWKQFAKDVEQMGINLDIGHNPLGWNLMNAVLDTINYMYRNGMKPVPSGYFGRDDI